MITLRPLLLILLLATTSLPAAEVLEVGEDGRTAAITQSQDTPAFQMGEYLCVVDDEIEIACGPVIKVSPKGAILRFEFVREAVSAGDTVFFGGRRVVASVDEKPTAESSETLYKRRHVFAFNLTAGMLLGLNYQMPLFHFQGMVTQRFSVGVLPLYMLANSLSPDVSAYGGFLTVNYYASRYYRGVWFTAGVGGLLVGTPNNRTRLGVSAAMAHVGYRINLYRGLNLGVALGGHVIERPTTTPSFGFGAFHFTGLADLGVAF